jgi:hypothetical protein
MAKASKPNQEALRTEARERARQMPAETAGGRLDYSADMSGEEPDDERRKRHGERRPGGPGEMTSQMKDKKSNQPHGKPKR